MEFIHAAIIRKRNEGCAILLSSAELDEVFRLSDRIITLYEGHITGEFKADRATREMMCGITGMFRVYGAKHIYKASISNEYYFEGLMVAMIAQYQILPTVVISILFAVLKTGAQGMESTAGVPNQIYKNIPVGIMSSSPRFLQGCFLSKEETRSICFFNL